MKNKAVRGVVFGLVFFVVLAVWTETTGLSNVEGGESCAWVLGLLIISGVVFVVRILKRESR